MVEELDLELLKPYALILAHGDDEIGVIPIVLKTPPTIVLYLTNGSGIGNSDFSKKRESEISRSWRILDCGPEIINFGSKFQIPDGTLHSSFTVNHLEILQELIINAGVKCIVTTHAEGGHQDHDTTFMVSQHLSLKLDINLFSFHLYCQHSIMKKLYSVMNTHGSGIKNEIRGLRIRFRAIVTAIRIMSIYRSQWKTWIGLGLPLAIAMTRKFQILKPNYVSMENYPESDFLFYESRGRADRASVTRHWSEIGIISDKHM